MKPKLTKLESTIRSKFTLITPTKTDEGEVEYLVHFASGVQRFRLFGHSYPKKDAEWMRSMLAKALANAFHEIGKHKQKGQT